MNHEFTGIVGISMGGMIAQTLAINYPGRVRTLTSIMSTTGDPRFPSFHRYPHFIHSWRC